MRDQTVKDPLCHWRTSQTATIMFGHSNRFLARFSTRISIGLNSHEKNCSSAESLVYRQRSLDQSNKILTFIEILACPA
jgi:hypothetical protein